MRHRQSTVPLGTVVPMTDQSEPTQSPSDQSPSDQPSAPPVPDDQAPVAPVAPVAAAPASDRPRLRDRVLGMRGVAAVAVAGLILGGVGGTAIGAVAGHDDHREGRPEFGGREFGGPSRDGRGPGQFQGRPGGGQFGGGPQQGAPDGAPQGSQS